VAASVIINIIAGALIILVLSVVIFSRVNLHPDEFSHIAASTYFQNHWFKLAVDHPSMLQTLIPGWGTSYLFLNDIVYSLAEKATGFLVPLGVTDFLRYRLFNFALLPVLLVLFLANRRNGLWFLLAFALSTQTWYLFSYFNGDALSMFFSLLLGFYYVSNRTAIDPFFWGRAEFNNTVALFYLLCVLVMFTRLHYAIFVFFIIGLIFVSNATELNFKSTLKPITRLAMFLVLIALPFGAAELKDQWVNDFAKDQSIETIREENKRPEFKVEHIKATGSNPHLLYLKQTGHSYGDLFTNHPWAEWSFQSFFGVYGFMNIKASKTFYKLSSALGVGVTMAFLLFSAFRGDRRTTFIVAYLLLCISLVIVQSSMYSWLYGFQAQGRYLLAVIPMIAVTLALNPYRKKVPLVAVQYYVLAILLMNVIGFAAYGVVPMTGIGSG
jgi:hypothetical protein